MGILSGSAAVKFASRGMGLAALVLAAGLSFAGRAEAACSANFSCSIGASPTCWFTIISEGSTKTVTVPAGESRTLYGMRPGDLYCSSNSGTPNLGNCGPKRINMKCT